MIDFGLGEAAVEPTSKIQSSRIKLRRALHAACSVRPSLRTLALSMVSHHTLMTRPGVLRLWHPDRVIHQKRIEADAIDRQTAMIAAGLILGVVRQTPTGLQVNA